GAVALAALLARAAMGRVRLGDWLPLLLVAVMLAATLYAWLVILPAAHAAREAARQPGTFEALAFARLHRISGALNGVTMIAGMLVLVVLGVRRGARCGGRSVWITWCCTSGTRRSRGASTRRCSAGPPGPGRAAPR